MNTSRTLKATIAAATAGFIALGPAAGGATAVSAPASGAPTEPSTAPVDVGQSVQLRVDANGVPNSDLVDFRWSITQITIPGGDIPETVTYPDQGLAVRSLDGFAEPTSNDNGTVTAPVDNHGTWGSVRTVGLMPQDFEVPVELTTKFTLNGEEMLADDMIGADGMVTTEYCIKNLSTKTMEVPITTLGGQEITEKVEAQVPMVAQASTLIPQRYVDLNMGAGLGGADGRGNTQAQWIVLPFTPINQDGGKACFGWAANVEDMVLPPMLIQVAPVYIPEEDKEKESDDGGSFGLPTLGKPSGGGPDLSAGKNEITAGVAQILEAMQGIANNRASGGDPLQSIGDALTGFFNDLGIKIVDVSEGLNKTINSTDKRINQLTTAQNAVGTINRLTERLAGLNPENLDLAGGLIQSLFGTDGNAATVEELLENLALFLDPNQTGEIENLNAKIDCAVADNRKAGSVGAWNESMIKMGGLQGAFGLGGAEPHKEWVFAGGPNAEDGNVSWGNLPDPDATSPVTKKRYTNNDMLVVGDNADGYNNDVYVETSGGDYQKIGTNLAALKDWIRDFGEEKIRGFFDCERTDADCQRNQAIVLRLWNEKIDEIGSIEQLLHLYGAVELTDIGEGRGLQWVVTGLFADGKFEDETSGPQLTGLLSTNPGTCEMELDLLTEALQFILNTQLDAILCDNADIPAGDACDEYIQTLLAGITRIEDLIQGISEQLSEKQAEQLGELLIVLSENFEGITELAELTANLDTLLGSLVGVLTRLQTTMIDLQVTLGGAGDVLSKRVVNLPSTASVVSDLVEKALQTDNAQLLLGGLDQTKAGFGLVSAELSAFIGDVVAQISAALASIKAKIPGAKASAQNAIAELNAKVNTLKGNVGGMVMAAHQSPLPYGGNPADAPEGTQLAGAYEYRMDAADWNSASTPARYVIGLLALFAAGGIGVLLARRGAA
jgi:hypothetical protein